MEAQTLVIPFYATKFQYFTSYLFLVLHQFFINNIVYSDVQYFMSVLHSILVRKVVVSEFSQVSCKSHLWAKALKIQWTDRCLLDHVSCG